MWTFSLIKLTLAPKSQPAPLGDIDQLSTWFKKKNFCASFMNEIWHIIWLIWDNLIILFYYIIKIFFLFTYKKHWKHVLEYGRLRIFFKKHTIHLYSTFIWNIIFNLLSILLTRYQVFLVQLKVLLCVSEVVTHFM